MENLPKLINQDDNTTIQINNSCFSIGRSLTCNHIIECLGVSRVHCFIKKNPNKYTLIDRSTNGTTVNDKLVKFNGCLDLKHGDLIKFGNLSYKFDDGSVVDKKMEKIDDKSEQVPTTSQINEKTDDNGTELLETSTSTITTMTTSTTAEIIDELLPVAEEFEVSFELVNCTNNNENEDKNDDNKDIQKLDKSIDNAMDTELTCSICSELFIKAVTLSCSHTFCKYCIQEWRKNRTQCPICRQRIITTTPTIVLDNLIESVWTALSFCTGWPIFDGFTGYLLKGKLVQNNG